MSRRANIVHAGSVYNNIEHMKEIYANHAALIRELIEKTSVLDNLSNEVKELKVKETTSPEELKLLQNELESLKNTTKEIESLKSEIDTLKSDDKLDIKKELLEALDKSIPKFDIATTEEVSDDSISTSALQCDYPYDIPTSDDGTDGWTINGIEIAPTVKDDQRICSIKTDYGGIVIDKTNSDNRWVIERHSDDELKFHINAEENVPLSVSRDGISTPKLTIGDKYITSVATVINNDTISSKSIPTTKAIVDFVNANIIRSNVEHVISTDVNSESLTPTPTAGADIIKNRDINIELPSCDVSTIEINGKKSLLIDNDSGSFSVKNNNSIITVKPSLNDGLTINDSFKLYNDSGILCILNEKSLELLSDPNDIIGRYVEYTGNVVEIDDMLALEVQIPSDVSSVTCGIVGKDLKSQSTFTHLNKIYHLPDHDENGTKLHFITIFNSGIHYIKTAPGEYAKGSLLVPSNGGIAKQSSENITNFCIKHMIPRCKVINIVRDKVVALLV